MVVVGLIGASREGGGIETCWVEISGSANTGEEKEKLELKTGVCSSSGSGLAGMLGGSLFGEEVSSGGE